MSKVNPLLISSQTLRRSCRRPIDTKTTNFISNVKTKTDNALDADSSRKKIKIESSLVQKGNSSEERIKHDKIKVPKLIKSEPRITTPIPDGFLNVQAKQLDLERTLLGGQSFRWNKIPADPADIFQGVIRNSALQLWRVSECQIAFKVLCHESSSDLPSQIDDYFQLKYNIVDLYKEWSAKDPILSKCCKQYEGFRILRQDPVENLFSFICATNNNIKRISQMVESLCTRFGPILNKSNEKNDIYGSYRAFPSVERLADEEVFNCLRYELKFGYRAKYITESAKQILTVSHEEGFKNPRDYLLSLRKLSYEDTRKQLMRLQGIGRKVADCICLMSMDHLNSVPVDCHIYEIVCRNYMPELKSKHKTLTEKVHDTVRKYFIDLHGPLAGWSTSVLFIAELKHLKMDTPKR